ncbi:MULTISPECIES: outer membrane protein transport protein [Hallerella]|uniref:Outer membrane protein transport protein (OMPP1/FadL/TodX) n=1 Tax=Hallerella succinigenes TaxID=1896222 RepID=A0A2M9A9W0_9BACT|nr:MULTISPECIES: outer membrane protein transport protein [Hallerella]MCI6874267.1 outer membrane protein transport protein [Hallerella sp.]MDD6091778.1 outer membrane protein transport protein [Hallerella succinigenes]MDY5030106.1 outer membrane protein transport protein [Hallerella succinigenes]PJJ42499.1 outer membrane protein transport protein (OMPP1/FadL/TodX) [Hallerella succinigenes]
MKIITRLLILACAISAFAAQGPRHKSLRAYAMGNAHVAIVDGKEAIYYNYAGLNQMGRLGHYDIRPETGFYPSNDIDMRLNIGGAGPFYDAQDIYEIFNDIQDLYESAKDDVDRNGGASIDQALADSLSKHPELTKKINKYDHMLFNMIAKADAELAFHNFGAALWVDGNMAPYFDGGLIIPYFGMDTFYIDAVAQMGGAYGITDKFAVGAGIKLAKRQIIQSFSVDASNFNSIGDTLNDRVKDATSDFFEFEDIGVGIDLGVLYQATRELRLGAACNNIFFNELGGERIVPNFTMGLAYSPRFLNKNSAFSRKVNFAFDYENAFSTTRNYKTLSHINFGMEIEQVLLAIPGDNDNLRALKLRLSGGFHGGYPSAGIALEALRFIEVQIATWGEERGYYTGQDESRIYMAEISLGF